MAQPLSQHGQPESEVGVPVDFNKMVAAPIYGVYVGGPMDSEQVLAGLAAAQANAPHLVHASPYRG